MIETSVHPKVEFINTSVANYAIQQNRVPLVRKFSIENSSDKELISLQIQIEAEPEFAGSWSHQIDTISPGQIVTVDTKDFRLSARFLSELTEKISGEIKLAVKSNDELIFQECYSIDILAYDQWNGIGVLPEMMAAFVTPNHPEISKIIRSASEVLNRWTDSPSFDAYQSMSPDRVKKQMAAIYEAIKSLDIVYCSPQALKKKDSGYGRVILFFRRS
jgi:hypothetical protein